jgi:hypothetical protein
MPGGRLERGTEQGAKGPAEGRAKGRTEGRAEGRTGKSAEGRTERRLGVVEALVAVRDQCPNGAARRVAGNALEAIKTRRPGVLREQAWLVWSATQGWRGDRAEAVRRALSEFVEETDRESRS